mmetsp:Transcript_32109/g.48125  ORF Transcript_32109/g.48125 Transcript_32109/m.48125 type:complete len:230 (-) Transcript_32109:4-693(-)
MAITPALFIRIETSPSPNSLKDSGNCFTCPRSSRSNSRLYNLASYMPLLERYDFTSSTACSPLDFVREVSTTVAPAAAKRLALSNPSPDEAPVMSTTWSFKEPASGSYTTPLLSWLSATAAPPTATTPPNPNPAAAAPPRMSFFFRLFLFFFFLQMSCFDFLRATRGRGGSKHFLQRLFDLFRATRGGGGSSPHPLTLTHNDKKMMLVLMLVNYYEHHPATQHTSFLSW